GHGAHAIVAEMLLDLGDQVDRRTAVLLGDGDANGVVDLRQAIGEDRIEHDALDLDDLADIVAALLSVRVRARHVAPEWVETRCEAGREVALAAIRVYRSAEAAGRASGGRAS